MSNAGRGIRFSIWELLLLTACVAAGLTCLKYADRNIWLVLANAVPVCLAIAAVIALADRGRRQAIAGGFAICLAIYLALLMNTGSAARGRWATEMMLDRLHKSMMTQKWIDGQTREDIGNPPWPTAMLGNVAGVQVPNSGVFRAIGHMLWALLFGYLGGRFAEWLYWRRQSVAAPAREPS
ncbi:MAG: hypothetical protein WD872_05400 [Pirellulaceae bacterium]